MATRPDDQGMRDHTEFVQTQSLPWRDGGAFGMPGQRMKLLS